MSDVTLSKRWWAPGPHDLPMRARLAAVALTLAMIAVVVFVWRGPGGAERVSAESGALLTAQQEAEAARSQAAELRQALAEREHMGAPPPAAHLPPAVDDVDDVDEKADDTEKDRAERAPSAAPEPRSRTAPRAGPPRPAPTRPAPPAATAPDPSAAGPANPRNPVLPERDEVPPEPAPAPAPSSAPAPAPDPAPAPEPTSAPSQPAEPDEPEPVTTLTKAELLEPDLRYYGMYTVQSPFNWAELDLVATRTGRLPSLAGYFSGWDRDFRDDAVTRAWQRGMLPMLTWETRPSSAANNQRTEADYSLPHVLDGEFDDYLRTYAREVAELGLPMAIRLNHEMNGDWYPWSEMDQHDKPINGNRPGDFAAAWRYVHDIFEDAGANEFVIWVWAPNRTDNLPDNIKGSDYLERLYPGDEYVDWVGMSGYHRPPYREDQVPTFDYIFGRTLDQLRALTDKPILLAEIGASEVGGVKPEWITSFFEGFTRPENDDILGFAWFNLTITSTVRGELVTNDWRVNSSNASLHAFATGIADPRARIGGTPLEPEDAGPPTTSQPETGGGGGS